MISILEKHLLTEDIETIEEKILYDLICKLMIQAECHFIYGDNENAFKLYASIKAILILFETCELTVNDCYWAWIDSFAEVLMPKI